MDRRVDAWHPPLVWRVLLVTARLVTGLVCRLRVTGAVSPALRHGPVILAINHVGVFDPVAVVAACRVVGVAPRLMATGGLFRAPVVGRVLRACGHIRVDRQEATAANALDEAADALAARSVVAAYPEGRITLDPGLWPERGKTGVARLAMRTGVPVIAVTQWGAHEVLAWHGRGAMLRTLLRSMWRRPVVRVHFGPPLDLSRFDSGVPGAAQRATDHLMTVLTEALVPLRAAEPRLPRYVDPTRPVSTARRLRRPVDWAARNLAVDLPDQPGSGQPGSGLRTDATVRRPGAQHLDGAWTATGPAPALGPAREPNGGSSAPGRGRHRRTGAVPSGG